MQYSTVDTLKKKISETELIQLTDDERLGAINVERVNATAIEVADIIDGHLRGRYVLPLDPVPMLIQSVSDEMSIYHLHLRKKRLTITQQMIDSYNAQLKLLGKIQKGEISLGGATESQAPEGPGEGGYKTNKASSDRKFSKDVLDGY